MVNYTKSFRLQVSPETVFQALTREIPQWWTEAFEGDAADVKNTFTVRFGDAAYKTMEVAELVPGSAVSWKVTDALINSPGLNEKKEWIGTSILWNIVTSGDTTLLTLTHQGLTPALECYTMCREGWQQFTESLVAHIRHQNGQPFRQKDETRKP